MITVLSVTILMPRNLISGGRQQERRRQLLLQERIARKYERKIGTVIGKESLRLTKSYEQSGSVPEASGESVQKLNSTLQTLWVESIETFGSRILEQGKSKGKLDRIKIGFDFEQTIFGRMFFGFLATVGGDQIARDIIGTTRDIIVSQVLLGAKGGLGQQETAKMIREKVPSMAKHRAGRIARTETHNAANFGANEAARETGLPLVKEWIAANQPKRTRDDHRDADGQQVPMGEYFIVGGSRLEYPGDTRAPAKQTVNCRCAVGYVVPD